MPIPSNNQATSTSDVSQDASDSEGSNPGRQSPGHQRVEDGPIRNSNLEKDGGHRDGVTAKPTAKRNGQSMSLVKKSIRVRTRMLMDKTVEPAAAHYYPTRTYSVNSLKELSPIVTSCHCAPVMASLPAQEMEVDVEEQSRLWVGSQEFSDLSHYLPNPSASCESMTTSATTVDSQCSCPASHEALQADTYGWEAELDRRIDEDDGCESIALTYRRANGSKSNLLQRVFKAVSSSSPGKSD
ncbi:hypothetical protein G7Z17_g8215 [Cylindrodendrum hubeiense]|uniref:Uncharacterized protein n=1 Tax=Cylindrodendrum hubeiense TaxID=595255 RepID=A0A9P5L973_9HYPO|nr:hypothetical protein G7Z17_g8215 [Cylindrodendrum hubeiense]